MIKYMTCTTCKGAVQVNNTGICLRCQGGFTQTQQGDELGYVEPREDKSDFITLKPTQPKRKSGRPRKKEKK